MLGPGLMELHSNVFAPGIPRLFIHYALRILHEHHLEMLEESQHGRKEEHFSGVIQIGEVRLPGLHAGSE